MITAPYNFVPLNEKVFYPPWAEDISHDIPFEDGESGVIDIEITAKSPIFIKDSEDDTRFCNYNGQYYIPATSIKGMVRNILEIMSFSKLRNEQFIDNTYAVRDLSSSKNFYMEQMQKNIFCGWLKKDNNNYIIEDCGIPLRIHHKQIDDAYNINFSSNFRSTGFEKTSEYKYNLIGGSPKEITISNSYESIKNPKYDKRLFCKYEKNGKNGMLVLTGQPTKRKDNGKMGDGKGFEFIFLDPKDTLKVEAKIFENFKFAYFDKRDTQPKESPDWAFWKKRLANGEKVPVFFQKDGDKVLHFGLSYLYKLPYTHSVKNGIGKIHSDNRLDLAQTIFGFIDTKKKISLKGRVQFSHFKAIKNISELPIKTEILGTPRASYYPIYIKQKGKLFTTFMDNNFSIAGRKKYPIHKGNKTIKTEDTGNDNIGTSFIPLKDGVIFKGKLKYHNLKKAELGAILSALTFHNTENSYHNIGLAKSLGYGKIDVKINNIENLESYLKKFELTITEQISDWSKSVQIKELLSMVVEQNNNGNSQLKYMSLEQFANNKTEKNKDYLRSYTELQNIESINIKSLVSQDDLDEIKIQKQQEKQEKQEAERKANLEQEKEKQRKLKTQKVEKAQNLVLLKNCKNFKDAMKIINDSLGKKPQPTQEQLEMIKNFYQNCKGQKVKSVEKFFKKFI